MVTIGELLNTVRNFFKSKNQKNPPNVEKNNPPNVEHRNQQNKRKYQQNIENKEKFYEKIKKLPTKNYIILQLLLITIL